MLHFSESLSMKKQTRLQFGWPEGAHIFMFGQTTPLNAQTYEKQKQLNFKTLNSTLNRGSMLGNLHSMCVKEAQSH